MGSKVDGLAVRDQFLPKNGLKTVILAQKISERLTSEQLGTNFYQTLVKIGSKFYSELTAGCFFNWHMIYNTMGSKVDGLAVRDHVLPKNGLKTAILVDTILDHLTSGTFNMFP